MRRDSQTGPENRVQRGLVRHGACCGVKRGVGKRKRKEHKRSVPQRTQQSGPSLYTRYYQQSQLSAQQMRQPCRGKQASKLGPAEFSAVPARGQISQGWRRGHHVTPHLTLTARIPARRQVGRVGGAVATRDLCHFGRNAARGRGHSAGRALRQPHSAQPVSLVRQRTRSTLSNNVRPQRRYVPFAVAFARHSARLLSRSDSQRLTRRRGGGSVNGNGPTEPACSMNRTVDSIHCACPAVSCV